MPGLSLHDQTWEGTSCQTCPFRFQNNGCDLPEQDLQFPWAPETLLGAWYTVIFLFFSLNG